MRFMGHLGLNVNGLDGIDGHTFDESRDNRDGGFGPAHFTDGHTGGFCITDSRESRDNRDGISAKGDDLHVAGGETFGIDGLTSRN